MSRSASIAICFCLLFAFSLPGKAQQSTIPIQLKHSQYPFQCHSTQCFSPTSERRGRVRNAEKNAEHACSPSTIKAVGNKTCLQEREVLAVINQCESYCSRAVCKKTDVASRKCVGGTYFR